MESPERGSTYVSISCIDGGKNTRPVFFSVSLLLLSPSAGGSLNPRDRIVPTELLSKLNVPKEERRSAPRRAAPVPTTKTT